MPRTAALKLVGLRTQLVNLPLSIYGPLIEHGTVRETRKQARRYADGRSDYRRLRRWLSSCP